MSKRLKTFSTSSVLWIERADGDGDDLFWVDEEFNGAELVAMFLGVWLLRFDSN